MARTINFVRDRRVSIGRQVQQDRNILRYVIYGLVAIGVVILLIYAVQFFLIFRVSMIQDKQEETRAAILQKEELERDYTIFAHKLSALTDLFGKRREKQEALAFFSSLFGPDVVISALSYKAGEEILSFTIDSPSVFVLDEVFDTINSQEVKDKYPQIVKESLARGANGHYGMSVTLPLGDSPLDSLAEKNAANEDAAAGTEDNVEDTLTEQEVEI